MLPNYKRRLSIKPEFIQSSENIFQVSSRLVGVGFKESNNLS